MKTLQQINSLLLKFEDKFGLPVAGMEQGSDAWHKVKLGVLSASNASKIVAKKDSETRATYMAELVAQICTGEVEQLENKYVEWGKLHEPAARSSYAFETDLKVEQVPFVFYNENFREGCSPDGIIQGIKGLEIKCPFNCANYIKFFCDDKLKSEYQWQVQYSLRVLGANQWDVVQYHPSMRKNSLKTLTIERDEEKQKTLADAVPQFLHDMDQLLTKIEVPYGSQWSL
jgi:exodeoxyribonuclease (lambda-induced)